MSARDLWIVFKRQDGEVSVVGPAQTSMDVAKRGALRLVVDDLGENRGGSADIDWAVPFMLALATGRTGDAWNIATNTGPGLGTASAFEYGLEIHKVRSDATPPGQVSFVAFKRERGEIIVTGPLQAAEAQARQQLLEDVAVQLEDYRTRNEDPAWAFPFLTALLQDRAEEAWRAAQEGANMEFDVSLHVAQVTVAP